MPPGAGEALKLDPVLPSSPVFEARRLYPTHVTRTQELMDEAIRLARRGATVDTADIVALGPWLDWAWAQLTA